MITLEIYRTAIIFNFELGCQGIMGLNSEKEIKVIAYISLSLYTYCCSDWNGLN